MVIKLDGECGSIGRARHVYVDEQGIDRVASQMDQWFVRGGGGPPAYQKMISKTECYSISNRSL